MSFDTKVVKRDSQKVPISQYFNPAADDYEPFYGANGAIRIMLYDANGNPLMTAANPGVIALPAGASTEAKQDSIINYIDTLETLLTAIKDVGIKKIVDAVDVADRAARVLGKVTSQNTAVLKSAPAVGSKTATTTAAESFGGSSRLANRYALTLTNEGSLPMRYGPSTISNSVGFLLMPGDGVVIRFDPAVAVPIYVIASGSNLYTVGELA